MSKVVADGTVRCWYWWSVHRPVVPWCPDECSVGLHTVEHLADGSDRFYCELHSRWNAAQARPPQVERLNEVSVDAVSTSDSGSGR